MKKTKNDKSSKKPRTMLDQAVGSMEDKKTNEDFNNQHPKHTESGLINENLDSGDKKMGTKGKQAIDKKIVEAKI
ncbi:MAG: hypothetical protein LH473_03810 [Chitinophagales bacterium]|nr:hypothetical protein [Chitinophagales bacterium]